MTILSVDLGSWGVSAGAWQDEQWVPLQPEPAPPKGAARQRPFRSCVAIDEDHRIVTGAAAFALAARQPERAACDFLHELGHGSTRRVADRLISPEVLTALLLRALVERASVQYGSRPEAMVLAVPACFNANQRRALLDAAQWADIDVLALVNAPTAAAVDWHDTRPAPAPGCVVVDFGAHKVDVSVVDILPDGLSVQATCGEVCVGLAALDRRLADFLADLFYTRTQVGLRGHPRLEWQLLEMAREARERLGEAEATEFVLRHGGHEVTVTLARDQYAELMEPVLQQLHRPLWQVQSDVALLTRDISHVLVVGGGAAVPAVHRRIEHLQHRPPEPLGDWGQVTARGALAFARQRRNELAITDVTPLNLVLETPAGRLVTLLERNMPIPIRYAESLSPEDGDYRLWQQGAGAAARQIPVGVFRFPEALLAAGPAQVTLLVDVDADGLPSLAYREPGTGWEHPLRLGSFPWRQVHSLAGLGLRA